MNSYVYLAIPAVLAISFVIMEIRHKKIYILLKGLTTLSIFIWSFMIGSGNLYQYLISGGLVLSLIGDVLLEFRYDHPAMLQAGGASFMIAHILYTAAFSFYAPFSAKDLFIWGILIVIGIGIYLYIKPKKRADQILTLVYIAVISVMVSRAAAIAFTDIDSGFKLSIIFGALLFYISDVEIAIHLYRKPIPYSMVWNSLIYFPAQMLIAGSILFIGVL